MHGIYKITNIDNGKLYIGSAVNINKRWCNHKYLLKNNKHCNDYLQKSWNKYGEDNFLFEIIEKVLDKSKLVEREQYYLDILNPEYNVLTTAGNSLGFKHSEETRKKISLTNKGKIPHKITDEIRIKLSKSNLGKKHSDETKRKMSEIAKNRLKNKENHPMYGKSSVRRKLDNEQIYEIINMYKNGYTKTKISEIIGIGRTSIIYILNGKTYKGIK